MKPKKRKAIFRGDPAPPKKKAKHTRFPTFDTDEEEDVAENTPPIVNLPRPGSTPNREIDSDAATLIIDDVGGDTQTPAFDSDASTVIVADQVVEPAVPVPDQGAEVQEAGIDPAEVRRRELIERDNAWMALNN